MLWYQGIQHKYIPFLYVIYIFFVRHLYLFCTSFISFLYVIYIFFVRHLYPFCTSFIPLLAKYLLMGYKYL